MKKVLATLVIATAIVFASCGGGEKMNNPLIGKWKLKNIEIAKVDLTSEMNTQADTLGITGVDSAAKAMVKVTESMTNAMTGMGEALANAFLKGSTYEFKDDGTVKRSILFGSEKGKYSVTPDNKNVKITMEVKDSKEESYTVTTVNENELILTKDDTKEVWTFEAKK